jgi:hypothetical protein
MGRKYDTFGNIRGMDMAMLNVVLDLTLKGANLWMDSVDFKKTKYRGCSKKKSDWSYKLNRPGCWFMFLHNGRGKVCRLWVGYSPKLFDSDFLDLNKRWIERKLDGAGIIADNHFEKGKKFLKNVTAFKIHKKKIQIYPGQDLSKLTKEKEQ